MKTIFNLKRILAIGFITLAIPLALQAEPLAQGPDSQGSGKHMNGRHGPACDGHRGGPKDGARDGKFTHGIPPYLRGVDLTEAQRDKLFNLMYAQIPTMREQGKLRHKTMQELRAVSNAESFDDAKAQQLAAQLASIEKDMVLARARNDAKVFAILTPEQRKQVEDARKAREERGHGEPVNFKGRDMHDHRHAPRQINS
ncbi:MAG TPA: Spy/CpxP family protein refolding chaperone [Methylophilaceae bacterium]|nr:Spy/CpxP family protein refolding chaperone [Methylophilaceae bacterium]